MESGEKSGACSAVQKLTNPTHSLWIWGLYTLGLFWAGMGRIDVTSYIKCGFQTTLLTEAREIAAPRANTSPIVVHGTPWTNRCWDWTRDFRHCAESMLVLVDERATGAENEIQIRNDFIMLQAIKENKIHKGRDNRHKSQLWRLDSKDCYLKLHTEYL
jgi:hypothetical protein